MTTKQTSPDEQQTTTAYHWVMTIQSGQRFNTRDAVIEVPSGFTRQQVFQFVINQFIEEYGTPISVLFFDLQPNKL